MAKLPVFWALEGRRVIVAGGSEAAAWKAELLAACGAHVHVHAASLSETFATLIPRGTDHPQGCLIHYHTEWTAAAFEGATLAIGDCETETEAQAFFDTAREMGVPVNVIDKPAFCQFQFGSIVNRSPVVVSISTDGAAPILAQAIRRKIETLLPLSLRGWAEMAQRLRETINDRLQPGPQRRAFWERFVDRAFRAAPDASSEAAVLDDAMHGAAPAQDRGQVTLVGAGPGDAELLTLKAVRALQAADVILFDDLVSDEVLELARREAKRMLVGKRGGRESCRQDDINDMMLTLTKAGKRVVRLKSGDPMIFGRAGEEIACLQDAGISVDVVPGITAACAMASRLGISLTHRDHAQSVRFVTGHSRKGVLPDHLDWAGLADPHTTTIYYMAGRTARELAEKLQDAGLSANTPVAIVQSLTRENEKRWLGNLGSLSAGMRDIGFDQPVLVGVGAVFHDQMRHTDFRIAQSHC
ncbi:uroporphyrin-III C-methyltransferase/precorrin-2 dehydrogenase/sirohydrochlorin ferrochelatase [Neorhizobium huautlense]|uniref:Uroporphyrin-III C-methyltransferase/precorrin-2 dehydrogenase/sirohydrochlorin ferrochelatase n=1 Tax=Neorhizobium huautlense TaxID=67774 RepID=A0ABT9PQ25_9HYPH|nr:uroporphyrin-III C-methyltransferase/precorrin-2 dehydrogenase/sirohydrochlorin ferrochelatase [Neorhizobium huautlense]